MFQFGATKFRSARYFRTSLRIIHELFIEFVVEIVSGDFPMLIGLDVMRLQGLKLNFDADFVPDVTREWSLPIHYKNGHAFVHDEMHDVMFTKPELERLHLYFHHPSTGKLYNLLRRYDPSTVDSSVRKVPDDISADFATCSEYHSSPFRFRVSMPNDEFFFNQELAIDLLSVSIKPDLHIIDTHKDYKNSDFITSKHSGSLWESFLRGWATIFIGYPSTVRLDQESAFDSAEFRQLSADAGIVLHTS